ncbi:BMC domain-containing protein [Clostridium magnum]|uniref:Propanediol utilization protein PduA n=1 Tax=Clostridium magnum DSM 2767 TaxID=1121326 RepID=A0A162S1T2_9CLOT|nr:BMC domain-containing protein [Clostridium magnum]KZL90669.1 propanediol utilization protein PduA [Clostridium magnum DSM 2767]SHI39368.1 Carboxysome shell and ethanolamine utilization microcompartment protein CcmL/EutN [Clostridium magnum DSM 2767]
MNKEALGVIETVGMAAAIQAADTCVKSANVELIGYELSKGSGLVAIKIRGNVGAVKAAIEAAKVSAAAINKVYATLIIPRPAEKLEGLIESEDTVGIKVDQKEPCKDKEVDANIEEENKDKAEEGKDKEVSANIEEENKDKIEESKDKEVGANVKEDIKDKEVSDLDNPSSTENLEEEKAISEKDEAEEFIHDDSSLSEQEGDEVCNICHDPACTRKKGQPKTLCINYKGSRR